MVKTLEAEHQIILVASDSTALAHLDNLYEVKTPGMVIDVVHEVGGIRESLRSGLICTVIVDGSRDVVHPDLSRMRTSWPYLSIIAIADESDLSRLRATGVDDWLPEGEITCHLLQRVLSYARQQSVMRKELDESRQRLEQALSAGRMVALDIDFNSGCWRLSKRAGEILGVKDMNSLDAVMDLIHPDDRMKVRLAFDLARSGVQQDFQFRVVRPDNGKIIWLERRNFIVYDNNGEAKESRGVLVDITSLKTTQDYLLDSFGQLEAEARMRNTILDSLPAQIALVDADANILSVNSGWTKERAMSAEIDASCPIARLLPNNPGHDAGKVVEGIHSVLSGSGGKFEMEYGLSRWFKTIVVPIAAGDGGAVIMHLDITDRKSAEQEVQRSQANLQSIFDNTDDCYVLLDADVKVVALNRCAADVIAMFHSADVIGVPLAEVLPPDHLEKFNTSIGIASAGISNEYETTYDFGYHGKRYFQVRITPVKSEFNAVFGFTLGAHEITRQKNIELALRESEEHFRALIENSGDMFCIIGLDERVTYVSPNISRHLRYEPRDLLMQPYLLSVHPDDRERMSELLSEVKLNSEKLFVQQCRIRHRNGQWIWVEGTLINLSHIPSISGIVSNFRDVTQKLVTLRELEQSKFWLEKACNVARMGYWIAGVGEDESLSWSPGLFSLLGVDEKDFSNSIESFIRIVHPDDLQAVNEARDFAIRERKEYNVDHRIIRSDGSIIWLHEQAEIIYDDSGAPVKMIGVAKDITERKVAEQRLRQSKHNLDCLINSTSDLVWSCNPSLQLISANSAFTEGVLMRYGVQIREGDSVMMMPGTTPDYELWKTRYHEALSGETVNFEVCIEGPAGEPYYFGVTLNPMVDEGNVVGVTGYSRNITDKRLAENHIRAANERFELLSIATNDALWDWDLNSNRIWWNKGLQSIYGHFLPEGESSFEWWQSHVHPDDSGNLGMRLANLFRETGQHWSGEYRFRCADNTYRHTHHRAYVLYRDGLPFRVIGAMQDVHELTEYRVGLEHKVLERTEELRQALQKEKEYSDMKSRFVSIASHEFRTPLSSIQFAADFLLLHRHRISPEQFDQKLKSIDGQVQHMMCLLDDVLTVGKGDSGKITVSRSSVDIRRFFADLISNVRVATKSSHQVECTIEVRDELIETDEKLLYNIFNNLLSNAIKFSPGCPSVLLEIEQDDGFIRFKVCDDGIGIPASETSSVFEPFSRGSNVGGISGTGLGLSIVKTAVALLEGQLFLGRSDQFKTIISVTLPCRPASKQTEKP